MHRLSLVSFMVPLFALPLGCDRGETPKAEASTPRRTESTPSPATAAIPSAAPATLPTAPVKYPEDLDVDAARHPQTRAKADQFHAIRPENLKTLKPGDQATVLVRADRGGGALYGSGPYTLDSAIRRAVVHAGVLRHDELGLVRIKVIRFDGDHVSEPRNGVAPAKWGKYHASFTVEKLEGNGVRDVR